MRIEVHVSPYIAISVATGLAGLVAVVLGVLYYLLKSKKVRETTVYLSGEPEEVVSMIVPSAAALYWGLMKRFAGSLYRTLMEKVHTGSLHDWFKFISSWLGLLLILSILMYVFIMLW